MNVIYLDYFGFTSTLVIKLDLLIKDLYFFNWIFFQEQLTSMQESAPEAPANSVNALLSAATALLTPESLALGLPDFPADSLPLGAKLLVR